MPDAERAACGPDDPNMYLSYPPLAGKYLRVGDVAGPLWLVSVQRLDSTLFAVLRTRPTDCRDEEGNVQRACRIHSDEGEDATRLPGVY